MKKLKEFIFCVRLILILLIVSHEALAQSRTDSLRKANTNTKIALADIIGNWYAADSLKSEIRFINLNKYYVNIEGIKHGVGNYIFILEKDSMSVNGTAANWPPYDCTLSLVDKNVLEIKFYQYFSPEPYTITYSRR